ncbi:transporter [Persephonella sp.]
MKKSLIFLFLLSVFASTVLASSEEEAKEAIKKESQPEEVLTQFERDYVLLKKKQIEIENTFNYTYYSANQIYLNSFAILNPVFLTLGRFGIERARRHIFIDNISLRYGLLNNLQIETTFPFIYRYELLTVAETGVETRKEKIGIGDISFAVSFQPIRETARMPAVITNLTYKSKTGKSPFKLDDPKKDLPTGSGYESVKFGVSLVKSLDPVVVFGGMSYSYNIPTTVNRFICGGTETSGCAYLEKVYPGDTLSINFGFAYALSYNFSMNFQFAQDYTFHTKVLANGIKNQVINSTLNSALLKVGVGWALSSKSSLNMGVSLGLTTDAPDYVVEIRVPYRF